MNTGKKTGRLPQYFRIPEYFWSVGPFYQDPSVKHFRVKLASWIKIIIYYFRIFPYHREHCHTMELDQTMEIGFSNLFLQYFQNIWGPIFPVEDPTTLSPKLKLELQGSIWFSLF